MHARGRDRAVSVAAIARQRSEERTYTRTPPLARSPSPHSDASLSPRSPASRSPTPPPTLSDQVHIAYALDDIHLAKVLLLRLQGIEVTSDSDPRIAAVKDEDFDACFIPFGRLDDGRGEPFKDNLKSTPTSSPTPRAHARRRADALRAKEQLWEAEARRFTEERARCAVLKRRESEHLRALATEQERVRLAKQKEAAAAAVDLRRRRQIKPTARTLNFSLVAPVPQPPPKFTYDFPFTPRNIAPRVTLNPRRSPVKHAEPAREEEEPAKSTREPNRVTFQQVLASMQGPLFPVLPSERTLCTSTDRVKARRQLALLDALLAAGVDLSPSRKGKGRAVTVKCAVCSPRAPSPTPSLPSPSTPSTSSSGLSRAGSWLSFGGSSRSSTSSSSTSTAPSSWVSASTLLSSPSDSPPPPKTPPLRLWLPGAHRTASPIPAQCQCRALAAPSHECAREPTSVHPLVPPAPPPHKGARRPPHMRDEHAHPQGPMPFTLALGRLVALARNLQAAYVRAVVVGYGGVSPAWDDEERAHEDPDPYTYSGAYGFGAREKPAVAPPRAAALASKLLSRQPGLRASLADVRRFLAAPSSNSESERETEVDTLAPVARLSPLAPRSTLKATARTELPAHLPYERVFAPPPPLPRSPWAPGALPPATAQGHARLVVDEAEAVPLPVAQAAVAGAESEWDWGRAPALRARAVPNSAFLRLKALHNDARGQGLAVPAALAVRRPRECLVALGVDRAPGSGLRFVYAGTVGV
ncbi:hypothetical protein FB451DRAFT_1502065 [Mycena latifolia]|nr:hypothetical protein FB451DRAFT_1502065 [Mycena latifolia]